MQGAILLETSPQLRTQYTLAHVERSRRPDAEMLLDGLDRSDSICLLRRLAGARCSFAEAASLLDGDVDRRRERIRRLIELGWLRGSQNVLWLSAAAAECVARYLASQSTGSSAKILLESAREPAPCNSIDANGRFIEPLILLSQPTRRAIVEEVAREPTRVLTIAKRTGLPHSLVCFHAAKLKRSGLLTETEDRRMIVSPGMIAGLVDFLQGWSSGRRLEDAW